MMFSRLRVLNAISTWGYFQLTVGLLTITPFLSIERSVFISPLYRKWGRERGDHFPDVTQWVRGQRGVWACRDIPPPLPRQEQWLSEAAVSGKHRGHCVKCVGQSHPPELFRVDSPGLIRIRSCNCASKVIPKSSWSLFTFLKRLSSSSSSSPVMRTTGLSSKPLGKLLPS